MKRLRNAIRSWWFRVMDEWARAEDHRRRLEGK